MNNMQTWPTLHLWPQSPRATLAEDYSWNTAITGGEDRRECTAYRHYLSANREFTTGQEALGQPHLTTALKQCQSHGQVETGTDLGNVGRRQVEEYPLRRVLESAVANRDPNPIASFSYLTAGKPDNVRSGQTVANINLNANQ